MKKLNQIIKSNKKIGLDLIKKGKKQKPGKKSLKGGNLKYNKNLLARDIVK